MDYKFIISKIIRVNDLTSSEKLCLIFIIEKINTDNESIFTNNEMASEMSISRGGASKIISSLSKKGYIDVYTRKIDEMSFTPQRYIKVSKMLINRMSIFS